MFYSECSLALNHPPSNNCKAVYGDMVTISVGTLLNDLMSKKGLNNSLTRCPNAPTFAGLYGRCLCRIEGKITKLNLHNK